MLNHKSIILGILFLLFLVSCGNEMVATVPQTAVPPTSNITKTPLPIPTSTPIPTNTPTQTPPSANALLAQAVANREAAVSFHSDMEIKTTGPNDEEVTSLSSCDYSLPEYLAGCLTTVKMGGVTLEWEGIVSGDKLFMTDWKTGEWRSYDKELESMEGFDLAEIWQMKVFQPAEFNSLHYIGTEKVGSRFEHHLRGLLPGSSFSNSMVEVEEDVQLDIWIDEASMQISSFELIREETVLSSGERVKVEASALISAYNQPVDIEIPDNLASSQDSEGDVLPGDQLMPSSRIVIEGAETTTGGLRYLETVPGDGPSPQTGDVVTMHFVGTIADGTVFGDTYSNNQPVVFIYGREQFLPGWDEVVGKMKAGGEAQIVVPPELGFGNEPVENIPPNSQLIFDIELLSVDAPPKPEVIDTEDLETTSSGLSYYDLVDGDGDIPEVGGGVTTKFTIWVREDDGHRFVISSAASEPISFTVGALDVVFPGWDEGVRSMKQGGKRLLVIPPELALGTAGGGDIEPDATLVMEIELIEVNAAPENLEISDIDKEDFIEIESGLKYFDLIIGDGAAPKEGQTVSVHYTLWLEDGTFLDSSVNREPFSFAVGTGVVIPGWDEGLDTMKVGGRRRLIIPADLAYGDQGSGKIPSGATLISDVELLSIGE